MKFKSIGAILSLAVVGLFSGCNKCEGTEPVLTPEDQSWLPYRQLTDSMIFVNQAGQKEVYLYMDRKLFTTEYEPGGFFKKICPEDRTAEGIYEIGTQRYNYPSSAVAAFRVHMAKSNAGLTKTFYWHYLQGNNYFYGFNDHTDSLGVAGTMYHDVHIFVNDTSNAHLYAAPFTHKLYFSKLFGLIRYDNTKNQIWERQP